jgi:hypothetical protein
MTNRREMLCRAAGALTGSVFIGCGLLSPALAQTPQRRREVVVNGKRVRTVDVHAHCQVPEANALMGLKVQQPSLVISPERIKAMDEQGIDIEALSINPIFWYKAELDLAGQVVKLQNEKLAETCAAQPDRFVGLASVALQHPDLAAEQLEDAVKQLGLRGALIGGSVNGEELSDPKFHPFWTKAEQLGALIFIHPQGTAELSASGRLKGNGVLENVIGNGDDDRSVALDFRGNPRCLPRAEDLRCSCRRLSAFLRRPIGSRVRHLPAAMHQDAQEEAKRIPEAALLRLANLHTGGIAPPDRRSWREPDCVGDGLSVSLDEYGRRPHPQHPGIER